MSDKSCILRFNFRTVYEKVCAHGGYSAHSYSHIPYGYPHKREAEPEAESDPEAEARDGKSYGGYHGLPGPLGHHGYGLPAPYGLGPGPHGKAAHPEGIK